MTTLTKLCLLLAFAVGCNGPTPITSGPSTKMSGRLESALAMKDDTSRHNTLVKLAEDAAQAGNGDVVLKAIAAVDAGTARDNTCAICSGELARQGRTLEATAIAKEIANETARNNTLAQIASGGKE